MDADRRQPVDRRRRPTPILSRYSIRGGRRAGVRRLEDPQAAYVDRLGQGLSIVLLLIFFFHCLDALLTLDHLGRGGRELNPFMEFFLSHGSGAFLGAKLGMAAVGLWFLGVHKNFPLVKPGIALLFLLYAVVVGYHVFLILHS